MGKKKTLEEVISKSNEVHHGKYDYSLIKEYKNNTQKLPVICNEKDEYGRTHGVFMVDYIHHVLRGHGCPKCSHNSKITHDEFIFRAKALHGLSYDYSKTKYVNRETKVCIICPKHGEFWQRPHDHLSGQGCPVCRYDKIASKRRLTVEQVIESFKKVHGDKYDYSLITEYKNNREKLPVICPEHGTFMVSGNNHSKGKGCPVCALDNIGDKNRLPIEEVKKRIKKAHGDKYIIPDDMVYIDNATKIKLICPKHGEFYSVPSNLWAGHGCPKCNASKLEMSLHDFLKDNNVNFIHQYWDKWLGKQSLDFYLPENRIGIECQGIQHFEPVDFNGKGGEQMNAAFEYGISMDIKKADKCVRNNVKLFYYVPEKYLDKCVNSTLYTKDNTFSDMVELLEHLTN